MTWDFYNRRLITLIEERGFMGGVYAGPIPTRPEAETLLSGPDVETQSLGRRFREGIGKDTSLDLGHFAIRHFQRAARLRSVQSATVEWARFADGCVVMTLVSESEDHLAAFDEHSGRCLARIAPVQ